LKIIGRRRNEVHGGNGHKPTWHKLNLPALGSATQLWARVSHVTSFAPKRYGSLANVWAFAVQRGGDLFND
jgi:hypothetical protein